MEAQKLTRYFKRTTEHIHRVQNNMLKVVTDFREELELSDEDCRVLMHNVFNHDRSKFSIEQFRGYVEMTEFYHQRKNLGNSTYDYPTEEQKAAADIAWVNHYMTENHHPEKHGNQAHKWSMYQSFECVCDLMAMAQEFNEGTCRNYFEKVWKPKQAKHFYDDFNWIEVITEMNVLIRCFEKDLAGGAHA